jgi:hypothetical protein
MTHEEAREYAKVRLVAREGAETQSGEVRESRLRASEEVLSPSPPAPEGQEYQADNRSLKQC